MGQRFQIYVNYGEQKEGASVGENLFAMHLQWCWGHFSIIRAHQLVKFLDDSRENEYNPFGLNGSERVGGSSFDGRREDLYILRALTEINTVFSSIVEGHDLMAEENDDDKWRFEEGKLKTFPSTIQIDPLAQDKNDGFLVIQATGDKISYAFCRDTSAIEPVDASSYLDPYRSVLDSFEDQTREAIEACEKSLEQYPLLSKTEMEQIFEKAYDKSLNIECYEAPELPQKRREPLSGLLEEAKDRAGKTQPAATDEPTKNQNNKQRIDPER